jgi:hypothetical protein
MRTRFFKPKQVTFEWQAVKAKERQHTSWSTRHFTERRMCFQCLQPGHIKTYCKNLMKCISCRQPRHRAANCKGKSIRIQAPTPNRIEQNNNIIHGPWRSETLKKRCLHFSEATAQLARTGMARVHGGRQNDYQVFQAFLTDAGHIP